MACLRAAIVLAALIALTPGATAHAWVAQGGGTVVAHDVTDDWGVNHGATDGHDLGAIYLAEERHAGRDVVRLTIGFAAGYGIGSSGHRRIDVSVVTPRVNGLITIATTNNQQFVFSGAGGLDPVTIRGPYQWAAPDGKPDFPGRLGFDIALDYDDLKIANGEAFVGIGATSYVSGSTKADFLPGGFWATSGGYVANPPSNATASPGEGYQAATFTVTRSTWRPSPAAPSNAPPTAAFSFSPASPRVGDTVTFSDASTDTEGAIASWSWELGDGATSTQRNPSLAYATSGERTIRLTVRDAAGLAATTERKLVVSPVDAAGAPPPAASAVTWTPERPRAGQDVAFHDATPAATSWAWDFGDGTTSAHQTPVHVYAAPGEYDVTLVVATAEGGKTSHSARITIRPPNAAPLAAIEAPASARVGEPVAFRDASRDDDGTIAGRSWDFGDGATSDVEAPAHTFQRAGPHTITLRVADDEGDASTTSVTIDVQPPASDAAPAAPSAEAPTPGAPIVAALAALAIVARLRRRAR